MRKNKQPEITYTQALEKLKSEKPKTRFTTKLYFWAGVLFALMAIFLFWTARGGLGGGRNISFILGIVATCFAVFFAMLCFIRFIQSRSIMGGLFLTTCISTGVLLGVSAFLPILVPPAVAFATTTPSIENSSMQVIIVLAQIGMYSLWFALLLFTIFLYVQPVKRIDKYLMKIVDGEDIRRVKIGHARQYKAIEEKIRHIARKSPCVDCENKNTDKCGK